MLQDLRAETTGSGTAPTAMPLFDPSVARQAEAQTRAHPDPPPVVIPPEVPTSQLDNPGHPHNDAVVAPGTPDGYGGYAADNGDGIADHTVAGPHIGADAAPHDAAHDASAPAHDTTDDPSAEAHDTTDAAHDPSGPAHDTTDDPSAEAHDPTDPAAVGTEAPPEALPPEPHGYDPSGAQHTMTTTSHDPSTPAPHEATGAASPANDPTGQASGEQTGGQHSSLQYDPAAHVPDDAHDHAGGDAPQYNPSAHATEHIGTAPDPADDPHHKHWHDVDGANSHL
jgi:hypothetical protein